MKTIQEVKKQLLFETKQANAFRMRRNEAKTNDVKKAWQTLIDLSEISQNKLRTELKKLENGLNGVRKNTGKTPAEAKKRVALKLELKKFGHQRSETAYLTTKQLETLLNKAKKGLKGLPSGMTKSIAKSIKVTGLRKEDGTLQKGYKYLKGGKIVKVKVKK